MASPILKWAGGKRQLLDEIYRRFPKSFEHYHEPFFGGGALFFDLEPADGSINDTNPRLINFYEQVRDRPEELIERCKSFRDPGAEPDPELDFSESDRKGKPITKYYYQQRARFNRRPYDEPFNELEEAALLLYLNRTAFNGLYRENSAGAFNVPKGQYTNPDYVRADEIRTASQILADTSIQNTDFAYVLNDGFAAEEDVVYFDPPYEPMSPTANFTDYSAAGFDMGDQERLLDVAKALDDEGVYVILSNSGVMYEMYDEAGFDVDIEGAARAINSDGENRDEVDEIIATNVPRDNRGIGQATLEEY